MRPLARPPSRWGRPATRLWGMTSAERLSRIYRRLGLVEAGRRPCSHGDVVVVDAGWVFDESLIKALAGREGVVLVDDAGRAVAVNVAGRPGLCEPIEAAGRRRGRHRAWTRD
jgi:hypothetical protein